MSRVADTSRAADGHARMDWAQACMPVLTKLRDQHRGQQPLRGHRVAGCVHLTKETGVLVRALVELGATVSWTGGNEISTQDEVAAALGDGGVRVFAWRGMSSEEVRWGVEQVVTALPGPPTLLVDNGGDLIRTVHDRFREAVPSVVGGTDKTTEGVRLLRRLAARGKLAFPVLAVNDLATKWDFDNTYGTGQSTIDGILRASGILLAGKTFVVVGFGHVGRGVALRARGLGATVVVTCRTATTALRATLEGFRVLPLEAAAPLAHVVCTTTGAERVVTGRHLDRLRDGAVLCNTGRSDSEIDLAALASRTTATRQVRPHMVEHRLAGGRRLYLLAGGGLVNLGAAEGNPSEVMDLSFANQLLALLLLVREGESLGPGVHDLPDEQDQTVAALRLDALGLRIDRPVRSGSAPPPARLERDDRDRAAPAPRPGDASERLAWAASRMPVLVSQGSAATGSLAGQRVAVCGHLTRETAILLRTLRALGAELACCASNRYTTDDGVAALLRREGFRLFGHAGMSHAEQRQAVDRVLDIFPEGPTLLVDEGATLVGAIHRRRPERIAGLRGATERTGSGIVRLGGLARDGQLRVPVLAVDHALVKQEVDNANGTGQSVLEALLRASGLLLAGKTIVVAGFGPVGRSIAVRARGLGCRVVVTEVRPTAALRASCEGYEVMPMEAAAAVADVVCTATGNPEVVTGRHLDRLKDGATLANAGHLDDEINLADLDERTARRFHCRPGNEAVELRDGRRIFLLGGGQVINLAAGEGNPTEVMDVSFAVQVAALECLVREPRRPPGIHRLPREIDEELARRKITQLGIATDG